MLRIRLIFVFGLSWKFVTFGEVLVVKIGRFVVVEVFLSIVCVCVDGGTMSVFVAKVLLFEENSVFVWNVGTFVVCRFVRNRATP